MHHTLLPLYERKALRREYHVRTLIVLCFMVSAALLLGVAALLPTFLRAATEERNNQNMAASLTKARDQSGLSAIEHSVAESQGILESLKNGIGQSRLSAIVEEIIQIRGPIKLASFSVSQSASSSATVTIQGIAPTRNELLKFKDRLTAITSDKKVELPISELAQSVNIQFALRINMPLQ